MAVYRTWALAAALFCVATTARAEVNAHEPDPAAWLRQVYDLYHRAEKSPELSAQAADGLIQKRASKSLAALFKKDTDCSTQSKGVCALDWDFVIDGQDWTLSNIKVGPTVVAGDKATVTVKFTNFAAACVNVYSFVREDGQWKVDDIVTKSGSDAPVDIAKLLRDYDYSQ